MNKPRLIFNIIGCIFLALCILCIYKDKEREADIDYLIDYVEKLKELNIYIENHCRE